MKSQVILPMPQGISTIYPTVQDFIDTDGEEVNLPLKTTIENSVMKWSSICGEVLKQTSQLCFANGANPIPANEIDFWNARTKSLESIYDQLCDPRVKVLLYPALLKKASQLVLFQKMSEYLELTNSTYLKAFKTLFDEIVAALIEARDVLKYLKILVPHLGKFDENDFLETEPYVKPLVSILFCLYIDRTQNDRKCNKTNYTNTVDSLG